MLKKIVVLAIMLVGLTGCYVVPMALIGPASSGFTTASIIQSTVTTSANMVVKQTTGKTILEYALGGISEDDLKHSYFPNVKKEKYSQKINPKK